MFLSQSMYNYNSHTDFDYRGEIYHGLNFSVTSEFTFINKHYECTHCCSVFPLCFCWANYKSLLLVLLSNRELFPKKEKHSASAFCCYQCKTNLFKQHLFQDWVGLNTFSPFIAGELKLKNRKCHKTKHPEYRYFDTLLCINWYYKPIQHTKTNYIQVYI